VLRPLFVLLSAACCGRMCYFLHRCTWDASFLLNLVKDLFSVEILLENGKEDGHGVLDGTGRESIFSFKEPLI